MGIACEYTNFLNISPTKALKSLILIHYNLSIHKIKYVVILFELNKTSIISGFNAVNKNKIDIKK